MGTLYIASLYPNTDEIDFIDPSEIDSEVSQVPRIINNIIITGNSLVSHEAILAKIPFHKGDIFKPHKSDQLIRAVYGLGYFENIKVMGEDISPTDMNLHIVVDEKDKIEKIVYVGNDHLTADEIEKKIKISQIKTIEAQELAGIIEQIKKLYIEKNYHNTVITSKLEKIDEHRVIVHITINEGSKSLVKRVFFEGNNHLPSKQIRKLLFTREDWLFGFFDKAGSYQPDAIDYDKHVIENFYQSNGFLAARVTDVIVKPCNDIIEELQVTFVINEGDLYTISKVSAPGNDVMTEEQILARVPIKPGQYYSKDLVRQTMESLRIVWGEFGYIYADVQPSINPDQDSKTVEIEFNNDLGNKITVNRIRLVGNKKTRDKVIRREINFNEGELLTTFKMDSSKSRIERLGYFDQRNGVNWKIIKIDENNADLDLVLKEIKTGKMFAQMGFGGEDIMSPSKSFNVGGGIQDTNFLGTGIICNITGTFARDDRSITASILNPWLFDRPIRGGIDASHRQSTYDEFKNVVAAPIEGISFISGNLGFTPRRLNYANVVFDTGFEQIKYKNGRPVADLPLIYKPFQPNFQMNLNRIFQPGNLVWVGAALGQDTRNHPIHPSRGYVWSVVSKFGLPHHKGDFAFFKFDADARWYTPLINEYDLILYLHGHIGLISSFDGHQIPYRELYHIGGPATVRGFTFGQIGPSMLQDSIGGKKAFWLNAELQFPITKDMAMRGVLFYDGGAGWDAPDAQDIDRALLRNNNFNYRHAIGFGIRLTYPTAARIDWGFKLDRNKRRGEPASEVHFTMAHDF